MDINKEFEKLAEEFEKEWHDGHEPQGIDDQYVEEMEDGEVEEARAYKNKQDDDEKKKKRPFAFGGKKKSRHGSSGYGKGEEVDDHAKVMAKRGDSAKAIKKMHPEISDDELKDLLGEEEVEKQTSLKEKTMNLKDTIKQVVTGKPELEEHCGVCDEQGIEEDSDKDEPGTQGDMAAYQKKRKEVAKKFGVKSCSELEGSKKKECFSALDKAHVADHEEQVELKKMQKEEKKEQQSFSKVFSQVRNMMKEKKKKMIKGYTSKY